MNSVLLGGSCAFAFFASGVLGISMVSCMLWLGGGALHARWRAGFVAAARATLLGVVLYAPILFGIQTLHTWNVDPAFNAQRWFLNAPFAIVRAVLCLAAWVLASRYAAAPRTRSRTAIALLVLFVVSNFDAIDWVMALTPTWHSSDFGLRWAVNGVLSGVAMLTMMQAFARRTTTSEDLSLRIDAANFLFAANLGWIYLMFVDYITAWSGNLPDEAGWYVPRSSGVWMVAAIVIVTTHVMIGVALLSRRLKQSNVTLVAVSIATLIALWMETAWLMLPGTKADIVIASISFATATCVIAALGYVWLAWLPRRMQQALSRG